jgi:hypothetical protein
LGVGKNILSILANQACKFMVGSFDQPRPGTAAVGCFGNSKLPAKSIAQAAVHKGKSIQHGAIGWGQLFGCDFGESRMKMENQEKDCKNLFHRRFYDLFPDEYKMAKACNLEFFLEV